MANCGMDSCGDTQRNTDQDDWTLAKTATVNILLEGPRSATDAALREIDAFLPQPVSRRPCTGRLELERCPTGTVILDGVDHLSSDEQRILSDWLQHGRGATRIVSTAAAPLFSAVTGARFDETLYYRLNTLLIRIGRKAAA